MTTQRIDFGSADPKSYKSMSELDKMVSNFTLQAGFTEGFSHLLRLRASQINGCAYCVRLHTRDALKAGETADRISVVPAWRDTGYFTAKERAALGLIEIATLVAPASGSIRNHPGIGAVLNETEIAAVIWTGVVINSWNRISILGATAVNP